MATSWLLQAIYTTLLGQSVLYPGTSKPPPTDSNSFVITKTPYGDLKGVRKLFASNVLVDSYLGIPFALPPTGPRRFSKPEPPLRWNAVRDATQFGNECYQRGNPEDMYQVGDKPVDQSEDCLYLNVYVPANVKADQPLAVMVWIHGGSFYAGAGSHYNGAELAAAGVIVVTINYRLDIFGFLSNDGDEMPGNYGVLDQIMALKWVKQSISSFGGDPNKVTIFGESAGSGSVSILVLSPLATGLFKRAIMESGVSLSSWTFITPVTRLTPSVMMTLVAGKVGCVEAEVSKQLRCLRNVDAKVLMNSSISIQRASNSDMPYAPRVENVYSVLPELPINLLIQNKFNHVDTIHGYNTHESGASYLDYENDGISRDEFFDFMKTMFDPYALTDRDAIINEIITTYIGNETDRETMRQAAVRARSDFHFTGPTVIETLIQSKFAKEKKHYMYEFQHKPSFSYNPSWLKATHGEEIPFVFGLNNSEFQKFMYGKVPDKGDNVVWKQMKTYWSNFAKYGNPTQTVPIGGAVWSPYNTKGAKYLKIDVQSQELTFGNTKATTIFEKLLQKLQTTYNFDSNVGRQ